LHCKNKKRKEIILKQSELSVPCFWPKTRDKKNVLNVCIKLFSSFSDSQIFRPWQQNILFCFKLMGREIRYFLLFSPIYHIYEVSKIRKTKKYFLSSTRKQKDEKLNPDLIVNKAFKNSFKSKKNICNLFGAQPCTFQKSNGFLKYF
jgi:hypothetical protein